MTPQSPRPQRVGWLGRTFGWGGSRGEWVRLGGILMALAGGYALAHFARNWSVGSTLLAFVLYGGVLALAGRDALRDLFGPVFFYDLVRVGRHGSTFALRLLYVISIGLLLTLMYFEWLHDYSVRSPQDWMTLHLILAALTAIPGYMLARELKANKHRGWGNTVGVLFLIATLAFLATAAIDVLDPDPTESRRRFSGRRASTNGTIAASHLSKFASEFFQVYVIIQMIVVALLTPVYVAGTIAVEKERKTLEFLFATDLRNREIVFGKMAARVLSLVMYALAGLPLLALMQLFGGIDPEQLLASAVATVMLAVGFASISIFVSVNVRRARDAIMLSYVLCALYMATIFLPILTMIPFAGAAWWNTPVSLFGYSLAISDVLATLADGNPIWALVRVANGPRGGIPFASGIGPVLRDFVIFWCVASLVLLTISIARLRRVALEQSYGPVQKRSLFIHPLARRVDNRKERRERTGRPDVGDNPVTWKEVFVDSTFKGGCLGKLVSGIILMAIAASFAIVTWNEFFEDHSGYGWYSKRTFATQWKRYQEEINGVVRVTTGVLGGMIFLSAAMRGAGAISGEKDKDTWLSLISTPLSAEQILIGKFWGCVLSLRRAFLVLVLVWSIGLGLGALTPGIVPVLLLLMAVYVAAFSWIGIYCSIVCRNTLRASIYAFFAALFALGGFWLFVWLLVLLPMDWLGFTYEMEDQAKSFFAGWTPPAVIGIFPILEFDWDELGPFDDARNRTAGLTGPIVGTMVWVVVALLVKLACETKLRKQTNRDPLTPRTAPE